MSLFGRKKELEFDNIQAGIDELNTMLVSGAPTKLVLQVSSTRVQDGIDKLTKEIQGVLRVKNTETKDSLEDKVALKSDRQTVELVDAMVKAMRATAILQRCAVALKTEQNTGEAKSNNETVVQRQNEVLKKAHKDIRKITKRMKGNRRTLASVAMELATILAGLALVGIGAVIAFTSIVDFGAHAPAGFAVMALGGLVLAGGSAASLTTLVVPAKRGAIGKAAVELIKAIENSGGETVMEPVDETKSSEHSSEVAASDGHLVQSTSSEEAQETEASSEASDEEGDGTGVASAPGMGAG